MAENYLFKDLPPLLIATTLGKVNLIVSEDSALNKIVAFTNSSGTGEITIKNIGTADAIGLNAKITGVPGTSIAPGTCGSVLKVGNSCTFIVTYTAPSTDSSTGITPQLASISFTTTNTLMANQLSTNLSYNINASHVNTGNTISLPLNINAIPGTPSASVGFVSKFNGIFYLGTDAGLAISSDGINWKVRTKVDGLASNEVNSVYVVGNNVYVANDNDPDTNNGGVSISTDGGVTFTSYNNGLGSTKVNSIAVSNSTIYAATAGGLSISTNGGQTFNNYTTANNLGSNNVTAVIANGDNIYLATSAEGTSAGGVTISTDGGQTFTNYNQGLPGGPHYYYVHDIFVTAKNIYAATDSGLGVSSNGGTSFSTVTALNHQDLSSVNVSADDQTIYVTVFLDGARRSTDGGDTFSTINTTTTNLGSNYTAGIYVDADNSVYIGTLPIGSIGGGLSVSKNGINYTTLPVVGLGQYVTYSVFALGNNIYVGSDSGVSISRDNGVTFTTNNQPCGNPNIQTVNSVFVTIDSNNQETIYVAVGNGGRTSGCVGISTDGGNTFTPYTRGLSSTYVQSVFVDSNYIYTGTYSFTSGGSSGTGSVSISPINAISFVNYSTGLASNDVRGIYLENGIIYVATQDNGTSAGGVSISNSAYNGSPLSFTNYGSSQGLSSTDVNNVYVANGTIYAAMASTSTPSQTGGVAMKTSTASNFTSTDTNLCNEVDVWDVYASTSTIYAGEECANFLGGISYQPIGGATFQNFESNSGVYKISEIFNSSVGYALYLATTTGLQMTQISEP